MTARHKLDVNIWGDICQRLRLPRKISSRIHRVYIQSCNLDSRRCSCSLQTLTLGCIPTSIRARIVGTFDEYVTFSINSMRNIFRTS
jgi:hypothetical protein